MAFTTITVQEISDGTSYEQSTVNSLKKEVPYPEHQNEPWI
jgi:hypothetical protein